MAVYVDNFECSICEKRELVTHTGKPTIKDFSDSGFVIDMEHRPKRGEAKKLVCFECESERMSDDN